jgi:hypothetical protein
LQKISSSTDRPENTLFTNHMLQSLAFNHPFFFFFEFFCTWCLYNHEDQVALENSTRCFKSLLLIDIKMKYQESLKKAGQMNMSSWPPPAAYSNIR